MATYEVQLVEKGEPVTIEDYSYRLSNGIPDAEAISSYEATGVPGSIMRRPDVPAAPPAPPERFGPPMMAGPRTGFEDPPIPAATHPDDGMPVSSTMPPGAGDPGTVGSGRPAPAKASDRATETRRRYSSSDVWDLVFEHTDGHTYGIDVAGMDPVWIVGRKVEP